jgi:hypothetical protein
VPSATRIALGIAIVTTAHATAPAARAQLADGLKACSLMTQQEIIAITKQTYQFIIPPTATDDIKGVSECDILDYSFSLVGSATPQSFAALKKSQSTAKGVTVQPLSGVGDEAFYYIRHAGSATVVAVFTRVGTRRLAIQDMVPADSAEHVKPVLVALAKAAAPKLK